MSEVPPAFVPTMLRILGRVSFDKNYSLLYHGGQEKHFNCPGVDLFSTCNFHHSTRGLIQRLGAEAY
jgi:hypothetical protein